MADNGASLKYVYVEQGAIRAVVKRDRNGAAGRGFLVRYYNTLFTAPHSTDGK
jgi:hypothetical protein